MWLNFCHDSFFFLQNKSSSMFVKLLNAWRSTEVQLNGFIYLSAHGWNYTSKQFLLLQKISCLYFSFKFPVMPQCEVKGTASICGTGPDPHTGGGEMNNNAALFSHARASQLGSLSIWLLLWPSIHSRVQSSHQKCMMVQYTVEPLGNDLSILPRLAVKYSEKTS